MAYWWDEYEFSSDPFFYNKPLTDKDKELLVETSSFKLLSQYFPSNTSPLSATILLYGTFGAGKTTLLKYLEHSWNNIPNVVTHFIDSSQDSKTYDNFEKYLLRTVYEGISEQHVEDNISTSAIASRIKTSNIKGHHVFLIDELHKVNEDFVLRFLRQHQSTIESLKDLPITIFFAGQETLANQMEAKGGITGVFDLEIPLNPLDLTEAIELIDRRMGPVTKPGIPYRNPFTRSSMSLVVDAKKGLPRGILKACRKILMDNVKSPKPIIIDELSASKGLADLTGDDLWGIRKIIYYPAYLGGRKKLEKLFVEESSIEKKNDYTAILNFLYTKGNPAKTEDLENDIKVAGNISRVLTDLRRERVIVSEISKIKGKFGTESIEYFSLEASLKLLFDTINDKFRVVPAAYLEKVLVPPDTTEESRTLPDSVSRLFTKSVDEVSNTEAINQIRRAHELYSEIRTQDLSEYTKVSHYLNIIQYLLISFNIHSRNEIGTNFSERLKNAERSLSRLISSEDVANLDKNVDNLRKAVDVIQNNYEQVGKIEIQQILMTCDPILKDLLRLFRYEKKDSIKQESNVNPGDSNSDGIKTIQQEIRELRAIVEQHLLKTSDKSEDSKASIIEYLYRILKSNNHLSFREPILVDAFVTDLKKADNTISKELAGDKTIVSDSVVTAISKRRQYGTSTGFNLPERQAALELLVGGFEEYCRYINIVTNDDIETKKASSKRTTLGNMLDPLLGEKFSHLNKEYNPGKTADVDANTSSLLENNLDNLLYGKDDRVNDLGYGPGRLILMTVVRNYCKHTARDKMLTDDKFSKIFDDLTAGFIWFYEYCIEQNFLNLKRIALYNSGSPPKLKSKDPTWTVLETVSTSKTPGAFYVGYLVYDDVRKSLILVHPDKDRTSPIFDIASIPPGTLEDTLPIYHSKCNELTSVPLIDLDEVLFLVKMTWHIPKSQNSARHRDEIAFLDKRTESGLYAETNREMDGYYALAYQSGLSSSRFPIITPVRFFTCIEEVASFAKANPFPFDDLPQSDIEILNSLLHGNS